MSRIRGHEASQRPPAAKLPIARGLSDYQDRNTICRRLGYGSYKNYLKSETWQIIRRRVLKRDSNICFLCGDPADLCHHTNYTLDAILGKDIDGIFSICWKCHSKTHYNNGQSVSLKDAAGRFGVPLTNERISLPAQIGRERKCTSKRTNGAPCHLAADRLRDGSWYCHIHDPLGHFQLNQRRSCGIGGRRAPDSTAQAPGTAISQPGPVLSNL